MSWVITPQEKTPVDPQFGSVVLLLHGEGNTVVDSSRFQRAVTAFGQAATSTAEKKFGDRSIAFDGTTDYLTVPASLDFAFGTGNFTIEFWLKTGSTANRGIFQLSTSAGAFAQDYASSIAMGVISGNLVYQFYSSGSGTIVTSANVSDNTWHHIAMARDGANVKVFVDGISVSAITKSNNVTAADLVIAGYYSTSFTLLGYIDEFRITKGVARYTANFTPPTAPFPDI